MQLLIFSMCAFLSNDVDRILLSHSLFRDIERQCTCKRLPEVDPRWFESVLLLLLIRMQCV